MAQIRTASRNNHPIAIGLFLFAYLGVIVILVAPKGTFSEGPDMKSSTQAAAAP